MPPIPSRLLVVAIDRLPAWILPPYGATWVAMPTLTALAGRGLVFERFLATTDDAQTTFGDLVGGLAAAHVVTDRRGRRLRFGFGLYQRAAEVDELLARVRAL